MRIRFELGSSNTSSGGLEEEGVGVDEGRELGFGEWLGEFAYAEVSVADRFGVEARYVGGEGAAGED
jgi:hypothetical protein